MSVWPVSVSSVVFFGGVAAGEKYWDILVSIAIVYVTCFGHVCRAKDHSNDRKNQCTLG